MPSTSHRRCQYQGPNCQGIAHAGHDVCARCYFDHVKPQLAAERQAVKRRRALKRERLAPHVNPVRAAIREVEIDRMLEGKTDEQRVETLVNEAIRLELAEVPTTIYPIERKEKPVPTVSRTSPKRPALTDEQKAEIVEAYRSGLPTPEIEAAYKIGSQTLYTLVRRAGVPLRGQPGQKYQPPRTAPVAPPVQPQEEPAPMLETPPNGAVPAAALTKWEVTYTVTRTETEIVTARNPSLAYMEFNMAHNHGVGYDVVSVAKVRP